MCAACPILPILPIQGARSSEAGDIIPDLVYGREKSEAAGAEHGRWSWSDVANSGWIANQLQIPDFWNADTPHSRGIQRRTTDISARGMAATSAC